MKSQYNAIKLIRTAGECVVSIEINGVWVDVITDSGDVISHIVESSGIEEAIRLKLND